MIGVRHLIAATVGILIGQWLAFSAVPSPANLYNLGMAAAERHDEAETLRIWEPRRHAPSRQRHVPLSAG